MQDEYKKLIETKKKNKYILEYDKKSKSRLPDLDMEQMKLRLKQFLKYKRIKLILILLIHLQ